jgi:hypothetical protein
MLLLVVAANLALCQLVFHLPAACSAVSSFTSVLTPSIYPTSSPLREGESCLTNIAWRNSSLKG